MRDARDAMRNERGVSLIEATVILAVISVLAAVLAPSVMAYVDQARQARAREDVQTIADAINAFIDDTGELQFLQVGHGGSAAAVPDRLDANRVNLLVSDGDIPTLGAGVNTETYWTQTVAVAGVDTFANHLSQNSPAEDVATNAYRNPTDMGSSTDFARSESAGFNAPYAWRGTYLRGPVAADPWGNRYAANVAFLDSSATTAVSGTITAGFAAADYPRLDVFVLSPGADEEIDTHSGQDGAVPGDDDFLYIVSPNAR